MARLAWVAAGAVVSLWKGGICSACCNEQAIGLEGVCAYELHLKVLFLLAGLVICWLQAIEQTWSCQSQQPNHSVVALLVGWQSLQ